MKPTPEQIAAAMTPTPEDIALAIEIEDRAWCPGHLDIEETGKLIAAHTAPLRERIKELEQRFNERIDKYMGERVCCSGHDCGCMGITRLEQFIGEEITLRDADLRELAKIGRLAVGEEKARCAVRSKLVDGPSGKIDHYTGLYDDFYRATITHREAVCAYLAKQEESK